MKVLQIVAGVAGKLFKAIPGSGIRKEFNKVGNKDKPETWVHFAFYALGVIALWSALYFGLITESGFLKAF